MQDEHTAMDSGSDTQRHYDRHDIFCNAEREQENGKGIQGKGSLGRSRIRRRDESLLEDRCSNKYNGRHKEGVLGSLPVKDKEEDVPEGEIVILAKVNEEPERKDNGKTHGVHGCQGNLRDTERGMRNES